MDAYIVEFTCPVVTHDKQVGAMFTAVILFFIERFLRKDKIHAAKGF